MPNRHSQHGFSLIEVIAAFLIFAIGFGVLLQILTMSLQATHRSEDYTKATLWAESTLDTVGIGQPLQETSASGVYDKRYHWDLDVREIQPPGVVGGIDENLPVEMYQLDLTVHWGAPGFQHKVRFSTIRTVDTNQNQLRGDNARMRRGRR